MWHWEQGRLDYFQFDVLRRIAQFALSNDLVTASRSALQVAVGKTFDPVGYTPWRNYQRVFRQMMIVAGRRDDARPTAIAALLAQPGGVTADEYLHFIAQATTEPSPALSGYDAAIVPRYPLLFAVRYLLAKTAIGLDEATSFNEVIGAYRKSGFEGGEDQTRFLSLMPARATYEERARRGNDALRRQARESLRVISQISYLHVVDQKIFASIAQVDATNAFDELAPVGGRRLPDPGDELTRRADLFRDGSHLDFFDYPSTVVSDVVEAGFQEGNRIEKTHLVVERNAKLRAEFFRRFDLVACDVCAMDSRRTYPWTDRVLDLHHKLPLASGTRVEREGTVFSDLVPVCPSCHRAVHRFYGRWLREHKRLDFQSAQEALQAYEAAKGAFRGYQFV